MPSAAQIRTLSFKLKLRELKAALKQGPPPAGALLAAASAHSPNSKAQIAVIKLLLRSGADPNETDKNGVTPLHRAVRFRSPGAVRLLLEKGARVNAVDRKSRSTPLHRAVTNTGAPATAGKKKEAREIIQILLSFGADASLKNMMRKTPRDYVRDAETLSLLPM